MKSYTGSSFAPMFGARAPNRSHFFLGSWFTSAIFLTAAMAIVPIETAWGRFEYAVRNGFVSCTQCHVSPVGGGIRSLNGKFYGYRNFAPNPKLQTDYAQADVRSAFLHTVTDSMPSRRGFMVMSTNGAVNLTIADEPGEWSTSYIGSYGFGMLETGLRDSYIIFRPQKLNGIIDSIIVGRTKPAFGILTDEHRTYTRVQSRTTLTAGDFETGVMISGTPTLAVHYDLMATSGERGAGASSGSSTTPWGLYGNVRLIPLHGPVTVGSSYNVQGNQNLNYDATAATAFAGLALDRLSAGFLPGVILFEVSRAHGWNNQTLNPALGRAFGSAAQPAWFTSIADAWSEALWTELSVDFTHRLSGIARAEKFTPDADFPGDTFLRYAGGFRWYFNSNANLAVIYENSYSTRAGINATAGVPGAENFAYALLHIWL